MCLCGSKICPACFCFDVTSLTFRVGLYLVPLEFQSLILHGPFGFRGRGPFRVPLVGQSLGLQFLEYLIRLSLPLADFTLQVQLVISGRKKFEGPEKTC